MNPRNTLLWLVVAGALLSFIFFVEPKLHKPPAGPVRILPGLVLDRVTGIQILPKGRLEIRAERTNDTWTLVRPFSYPAQPERIRAMLTALQSLTAAATITAQELKGMRQPDEQFGFDPPQKTIVLRQGDEQTFLHIGSRTAPGDQVFVQVVGIGDVYVAGTELLDAIPNDADDWRDRQVVDLQRLDYDRLLVTNAGKAFELERNPTNRLWRMFLPGWEPRADNSKVEQAIQCLQNLRAVQFVSDDPKADLDSFGLQSPELSLALDRGTNALMVLEFGKSPTNRPDELFARRTDQNTVLTVSKAALGPWRAPYEVFRDRHLVTLTAPLDSIEVRARDQFTLQRETNGTWRVLPEGFAADPGLVGDLITNLSELQVAEFYKDVVTAPDLPDKGLASPSSQFILRSIPSAPGATSAILAQIDFGTNRDDKVFARRADENSLYTVRPADLARLPTASWELRERRIWRFTEDDVARILIHQRGRNREIVRKGPNRWALAPGSEGVINDLALDEVAHRLGQLAAASWVARGDREIREAYGFPAADFSVTVELKNKDRFRIEFGNPSPSGAPYAATSLDGQTWVFELPATLFPFVQTYLMIPPFLR